MPSRHTTAQTELFVPAHQHGLRLMNVIVRLKRQLRTFARLAMVFLW